MEQNKLKLEDYCLTIEQAKELQELGVNMSDTSMIIIQDKQVVPRNILEIEEFFDFCRYDTPTLTNTEMLEMLPRYINFNKKLRIYKSKDGIKNMWIVSYEKDGQGVYVKTAELLRDALFEMIKFLKKLII